MPLWVRDKDAHSWLGLESRLSDTCRTVSYFMGPEPEDTTKCGAAAAVPQYWPGVLSRGPMNFALRKIPT
jgi:hypothetical protein